MEFKTSDGCRLYYECYGEGPTLLMLHGNGEDSTYFQHQIEYFQQHYCVLVIDMRAHGKSSYHQGPLNFHLFAQDVYELLIHLKIEKTHILGFSDGGNTAIQFALQHGDCVQSLILNGANLHPRGVKWMYQIPIVIGYGILCLFPKKHVYQKQQVMNLMVHHPDIAPNALRSISCPTLVLVGDKDMIKQHHSEMIAQHIPHATLRVIKGNHFIARKESETYTTIVEEFLSTI